MRIPLATTIKTRTGVPAGKDARLVNSYAEVKGEQSVVRKRPCCRGGVSVGTGTAQGGIGFTLNGTDYLYTFNGDTGALDTLASIASTLTNIGNWSASTSYLIGEYIEVLDPLDDPFNPQLPRIRKYSLVQPNLNKSPDVYPNLWSLTAPAATRFKAENAGSGISSIGATEINAGNGFVSVWPYFGCGNFQGAYEFYYLDSVVGVSGVSANQWSCNISGSSHVACPGIFVQNTMIAVTTAI